MRQVTRLFASVFKEYVEAFRLFSSNARLYLLGSLLLGIGTNMVQLLLNLYLQRLAFGEAAIGSVLSLRALGSFVVALPASFIVARADSRLLLASAAFLSAVSYTGQALASTYGPMAAAVLFSGAFSSLYQVAGGPFFMKNSGPTERIHLFALNSALGMGTGLIGSLAGGALKDFVFTVSGDEVYAYRAALVLGALFVGAAMAPFLGIREPVSGSAGGPAPGRRAPLGRINVGLFARLLLPGLFVGMGAGLTIPWLNLYLKNTFGLGDTAVGLIVGAGQVGTFLAMVAGPPLARRLGKPKAIFAMQALSVPFIMVLAYLRFLPLVIAAFIVRQALMNMVSPISDNFALEQVPPSQQHLMNALKMLNWTGSWALAALIAGPLIEKHGFGPSFTLTAVLYSLSSLLFWLFFLKPARAGALRA